MPDLSSVLGVTNGAKDWSGVMDLLGLTQYSYLKYISWQDIISNAPLFSKILFVATCFVLVIFLGMVRRKVFHLTMNGAVFGMAAGVLSVICIEAALIVGGKIVVTRTSGAAIGETSDRLKQVLGTVGVGGVASDRDREAVVKGILDDYAGLSSSESAKVSGVICK